MSCHVMSCHVMSFHVMSWHAHVMSKSCPCHIMSCPCHVCVMSVSCPCHVRVISVSCPCHVHVMSCCHVVVLSCCHVVMSSCPQVNLHRSWFSVHRNSFATIGGPPSVIPQLTKISSSKEIPLHRVKVGDFVFSFNGFSRKPIFFMFDFFSIKTIKGVIVKSYF